ncbi:MAG: hypothetical protein KJO08_10735, partial [Gammaproteobacteria bacterium]|nr:hypothetical protein [Gammaproteobacteria bacterium]
MWKRWRIWFGSALIVVLAGCMAAAQHREDMEKVHLVARTESIDQALVLLENYVLGKPGKDGERSIKTSADIIDLLEIGALYHYAGRYERSNEALEIVYAYYADEEMKAHISMSKIALGMLKSTLSEGLGGPYKLSGYEKVYLHTLKALNYLMLGDLEAARVEVRRGEHQHKLIEDKLAEDRAKEEESESSLTELLEGVSRLSSATDFQQNSGSEGESDQKNQDWSSPLATGALIGALPVVAVMGGVAAFQKNQEDAKNAKDAGEAKNTKNTQNTKEKVNLKQNESPLAAEVASREAFFKDAGLTAKERALIKKMKDGYRNAMTYNLSSVVYEANKESDDAMLDLYKSYGLHSNPAVGDRFVRLAVHKKRTRDKKIRNIYRL